MDFCFKDIKKDKQGKIKMPVPMLMRPDGKKIGLLSNAFEFKLSLKFANMSEFTFVYPRKVGGKKTPFYDNLENGMLIELAPFGLFMVCGVGGDSDGAQNEKTCKCESIEREFYSQFIVFGAGTYRLYNPLDPKTSILGMMLELVPTWKIGEIPSSLLTRYRTFESTNERAYNWLVDTAADSFGCRFDFDNRNRIVNVIDTDKMPMSKVFLSDKNVLKEIQSSSKADDYATVLSVTGADDVSIRNVNPTGENYIYNLDDPIRKGYIDAPLASKWADWENVKATKQPYYTSLVALKNSASGRNQAESAKLADLNRELKSIQNRKSTIVEKLSTSSLPEDTDYFKKRLSDVNAELKLKEAEITAKEAAINVIKDEYDSYMAQIAGVSNELKPIKFFTADELFSLKPYFMYDSFEDATFAVFESDISGEANNFSNVKIASVGMKDITLTDVKMQSETGRRMFNISGGFVSIAGTSSVLGEDGATADKSYSLTSEIVNCTLDHKASGELVLSAFLGNGIVNEAAFPSGTLTITCNTLFDDDALLAQMGYSHTVAIDFDKLHPGDDSQKAFITVLTSSKYRRLQSEIVERAISLYNSGRSMQYEYGLGNVDLTRRPEVEAGVMRATGYDVEDGEYATLYSMGFDTKDINGKPVILHVTPILPDGTVMRQKELEDYIYANLDGKNAVAEDKNRVVLWCESDVKLNASGEVSDEAWEKADKWDVALHEAQADYFEEFHKFSDATELSGFVDELVKSGAIKNKSANEVVTILAYIGACFAKEYYGNYGFSMQNGSCYLTRNVTEYQRYSVEQALYDRAVEYLKEISTPMYELDINSGNIIWATDFEQFKDNLRLGDGVYIKIDDDFTLKARLLEVNLNYKKPSDFNIIVSSTYTRLNNMSKMWKESAKIASVSRSSNSNRFKNSSFVNSGAMNQVKDYINNGLDYAKQVIKSSKGQETVIDDTGITSRCKDDPHEVRITNGMIALNNRDKDEVSVAIGLIYNPVTKAYEYCVNAPTIAGDMILGTHLEMHCTSADGKLSLFQVTGEGAELNGGRFYVTRDGGGQIVLDPLHGLALGKNGLYTINEDGTKSFNMENANFYADFDGKLHLKDIDASGTIHGSIITGSQIYIGGNNTAENCVFGVDALGKVHGLETPNGRFRFDSEGRAYLDNDTLISGDLNVTGNATFGGSLTLAGNINMTGTIKWGTNIPNKQRYAASKSGPWHETMLSGDIYCCDWNYTTEKWGEPYPKVGQDGRPGSDAKVPNYIRSTYIDSVTIKSPLIEANEFNVRPSDEDDERGAFNIFGMYDKDPYHFLQIQYSGVGDSGFPGVTFRSPHGATGIWDFGVSKFRGNISFRGANVDFGDNTVTAVFGD